MFDKSYMSQVILANGALCCSFGNRYGGECEQTDVLGLLLCTKLRIAAL